ncbi:MAG: glycosyltransferase family 2 protein [Pseudomonadota bacterium]
MSLDRAVDGVDASTVLAVVPTLNEEMHIETCIRSLMTGDATLRELPIVIVDGGSTDETCLIVERLQSEFSNLTLLENPKRLQSAAINLAAAQFGSEQIRYLVRCDAHSIYPENFILNVAQSLASKGVDSLVIPMDAVGTTCFEKANAWIVDTPLGSGGAAHRGGATSGFVDHGHHAGFLLNSFLNTGGYDETFSHNEDAEYDERLRALGGQIYLDSQIRIQYVPRGNLRSLAKQYFNYGKGRSRNISKHGQSLRIRQMLPIIAFVANLLGLLGGLVFWPLFALPFGYAALLSLASVFVSLQKRSICGVWAGLALGVMHMSWALGFILQKSRNKSAEAMTINALQNASTGEHGRHGKT